MLQPGKIFTKHSAVWSTNTQLLVNHRTAVGISMCLQMAIDECK